MAEYKNQHIVPRKYLSRFADPTTPAEMEPYLWIVDRGDGTIRRKSPKKLTVQSYFYSFDDEHGEKNHEVENFLSLIEGKADPVLEQLSDGREPADLTPEERAYTSVYLALLQQRTPAFLDHMNGEVSKVQTMVGRVFAANKGAFDNISKQMMDAGVIGMDVDIEELRQFALSDNYDVTMTKPAILDMFVRLAPAVGMLIVDMKWRVLRAKTSPFITSDAPVSMISTEPDLLFMGGIGWHSPYMEAFVPLAPTAGILISFHHPEGSETVTASQVAEANTRTFAFSRNAVFGSQPDAFLTLDGTRIGRWSPLSDELDPRYSDDDH